MAHGDTLINNRQQSAGLMNRVFEGGAALLNALKRKMLGSLETPSVNESQRRAQKALDSTKIQLRLLSSEGDLEGIRFIAETTDEPEIASHAVSYLAEHAEDLMLPHLQHLAGSCSHACLPSLICLFNNGQTEFSQELLRQRLVNGDYFQLIQFKKARAFLLLDVLGAIDEFNQSTLCLEYFAQVWTCLADRPDEQEKLLCEMLGDLNPGGLRYFPDSNMIPQAVKIQVLQLLHAIRPASYERSLWYASRNQDDTVACTAATACTEDWQNEGQVPAHLEPFSLLNLNLLLHLSKIASTFQWQGRVGVADMYSQWVRDREELKNLDPRQERERYVFLKNSTEKVAQQLAEITTQRLNALQPVVDAVTTSLGLPHARLRSTDVAGVTASYLVGTGTVEFSQSVLLDDGPLTEEFMSSLLHELTHMEQDALIIRMIADLSGLQFGQHGSKLQLLFQRYADAIGYAPDSIFLLEVLRLRRDKLLGESEKKRAERLVNAAYDNMVACQEAQNLEQRIERLQESVAAIESGGYDLHLLDCLRDERSLQPLFENGYVPAVLIDEIRNCKARIDQIIKSIPDGQSQPAFGNVDAIAMAQDIISTDAGRNESPVSAVLERFRIVVSHMLVEENRRLDNELSEIRRSGYHESEAYAISDRVEVIVKALRKGWYELTSQS